ncbi:hypothetical protein ACQ4LE_004696 [Meloidogyne hapla]
MNRNLDQKEIFSFRLSKNQAKNGQFFFKYLRKEHLFSFFFTFICFCFPHVFDGNGTRSSLFNQLKQLFYKLIL